MADAKVEVLEPNSNASETIDSEKKSEDETVSEDEIQTQKIVLNTQNNQYAVSALSLKSIKRKKELEANTYMMM